MGEKEILASVWEKKWEKRIVYRERGTKRKEKVFNWECVKNRPKLKERGRGRDGTKNRTNVW
jgi:hypothetical protein